MVERHVPGDRREEASRSRFLAELEHLDDPYDEAGGPVHVTASAVVIGARGTVLHRHRRLHRWLQPGGHIDHGEAPWEAAIRETQEETGLPVRHPGGAPAMIHLDVHAAALGHTHLDLRYLLESEDVDPVPAPGESPSVRWFSWEAAEAIADEALIGALRAARER